MNPPFLRGYRHLKIPIIDEFGSPAWPELFPISKIDEIRDTVGPRHFSAQMMLEYVSIDRVRLDPGAVCFYDSEFDTKTAKIKNHDNYDDFLITGSALYWDPSSGREGSDHSVCTLLYRDDKNRRVFIHDILYLSDIEDELHPLAIQCDKILNFMKKHNQKVIGIETNGVGGTFPEILRDAGMRRGTSIVVKQIANHKRKELRIIDSIEPLLTTGRLFSHERVRNSPLISEMFGWSPLAHGEHDDGLDAIAGAIMMPPNPIRALGTIFKKFNAKTDFKI